MSGSVLDSCLEEWQELKDEYKTLEETHKAYCKQIAEMKNLQTKCMSSIGHQRYRMKQIQASLKRYAHDGGLDAGSQEKLEQLQKEMVTRRAHFREMEEVLPHENGIYLKVILGSVNVSLLSKQDKFKYKENYESFKFYVTLVSIIFAICIWLLFHYRVTDAAFQFLLVWYYCTLTIREHILKVNGSRIRGWWITHHFISTVCAGILLIWPEGWSYHQFRNQFVIFSLYLSLVQLVQYYYQKACLYKMRALGERHSMDLTVEGFQSWMWRGLGFVLPFLLCAYIFQLYNAWVLFQLSRDERTVEWQVLWLSFIFFVLGAGNTWTTYLVVRNKLKHQLKNMEDTLRNKYRFMQNGGVAMETKDNQDLDEVNQEKEVGHGDTEEKKDN